MRILIVEDNPGDVRLFREHLLGDRSLEVFTLAHADRLAPALESLEQASFDAVLLDLSLPDSQGIDTLTRVRAAKPSMPIVVLTSLDDEVLGLQLLQAGAQDYLVKGELTASLLRRSLRYAAERKRAEVELRRSEVFLESIVENIPHMIFVKDAGELRFVRFNRAGEELLGHTRQNLIGKSDYELFPKEEADFFTGADRDVLRKCEVLDIPEEPILTRAKGQRCLHTKKIPILDENGQPVYLLGISEDITERKRAENQLQRSFELLRTLSQRLDVVREEERTRIARELHDELGVRMTCMKMDLTRLLGMLRESLFPREKMEDKIRSMSADADSTIAEVQRLAAELRPGVLDDLGLIAAIEWQCQDFERRSGIRCLCEASSDEIKISPSRATAAFRICQEALTNIVRHAKATFVRVLIKESGDDVLIEIQDNGSGIPADKINDGSSLGLLGMKERSMAIGGWLSIAGWPGKGTTVTLRLRCQDA
ncbi:MAG TPA: response regulator [Nitrospira sp.]|jgi:two-component system, NarL family, sensor histidine kinase UhpB|nr:response regulator [Nitrospira sp.]